MDSIHGFGFLGREIEFFENELIGLGIVLDPFPDGDLVSPIVHVVEYPPAGLILISADERTLPPVLVSLLVEFLFPDILMHLGAGNPPV